MKSSFKKKLYRIISGILIVNMLGSNGAFANMGSFYSYAADNDMENQPIEDDTELPEDEPEEPLEGDPNGDEVYDIPPVSLYSMGDDGTDDELKLLINGHPFASGETVYYGDPITFSLSEESHDIVYYYLPTTSHIESQWKPFTNGTYEMDFEPGRSYYIGFDCSDGQEFLGKYVLNINKATIGSITDLSWPGTTINLTWNAPTTTVTGAPIISTAISAYVIKVYKNGKAAENVVETRSNIATSQYDIDEAVKGHKYGTYYFSVTPVAKDKNRYEDYGEEVFSDKFVYADETNPVISSYTVDNINNKLKASVVDNETGIIKYAFSSAVDAKDVENWINVDADKAGKSGEVINLEYDITEGGTYYLYVMDNASEAVAEKASNVSRSEQPVQVTKIVYNNTYSLGVKQAPVEKYFYGESDISVTTPSRTGFTFGGWKIGSEGSTDYISDHLTEGKIVKGSQYFATTTNLYASWSNKNVAVSIVSSDDLSKDYDNNDITLKASISAEDLEKEDNVTAIYQWYKDGVALDGANLATLNVKNVSDSGKYTVKVELIVTGETDKYEATSDEVEIDIRKIPLTISANEIERVYGQELGSTFTKTDFIYTGLCDGDDSVNAGSLISITHNGEAAYEAGSSVGSYYVLPTGFTSDNYTISCSITKSLKIVPKDAEAEGSGVNVELDDTPVFYEDANKKPAVTITDTAFDPGVVLTDSDYTVDYQDYENATENAKAVITFKGNYKGSITKTYKVQKNEISVSVTMTGWKYGGFDEAVNAPVVVASSDRVSIPKSKIHYYFREKIGDTYTAWQENTIDNAKLFDAGEYQVYVKVDSMTNYNAASSESKPADFTISKRVIILTSKTKEWTYTGTTYSSAEVDAPASATINGETVTADGFALGDSFIKTAAEETITDVGQKKNTITFRFASNTKEKNYDIKTVEGTISVTEAKLVAPNVINWSRSSVGTASCISVTRPDLVVEYEIELYSVRNGLEEKISTVISPSNSYDFREIIRQDSKENGLASYYFRVKSIPADGKNKNNYKTDVFSEKSAPLYTAKVNVVVGDEGIDKVTIGSETSRIVLMGESPYILASFKQGYAPAEVVWVASSVQDTMNNYIQIDNKEKGSTYCLVRTSVDGLYEYTLTAFSKDEKPVAIWSFENDYKNRYSVEGNSMSVVNIDYIFKDSLALESYGVFKFSGDAASAMDSVKNNETVDGTFALNQWTKVGETSKDDNKNDTYSSRISITEPGMYYVAARDSKGQVAWAGPINVYQIKFSAGDGTGAMDSILKVENYDIKKLPNPDGKITKSGYSFSEWEDAEHKKRYVNEGVFSDNRDATLEAKFSKEQYKYTVRYYEMGVDGKYSDTPTSSVEYKALINSVIHSTDDGIKKEIAGFTFDATKSDEFIKVTDNEHVLNIYYSRNKYKITYKYTALNGVETAFEVDGKAFVEEYYWGTALTKLDADKHPTEEGYDFIGWSYSGSGVRPTTMPVSDVEATGYFKPKQSEYFVHYYVQGLKDGNADTNYSEKVALMEERGDEHGNELTFTITEGEDNEFAKTIEGFSIDKIAYAYGSDTPRYVDAKTSIKAEVNKNKALHIYYYYTRNEYKVSLNVWKSGRDDEDNLIYNAFWTYKYGDKLSAVTEKIEKYYEDQDAELTKNVTVVKSVAEPALDGYSVAEYKDWSTGDCPEFMPAGDVTLARDYIRNSDKKYLVNVYFQNENEKYVKTATLNYYAPQKMHVSYKGNNPVNGDTYNVYASQISTIVTSFDYYDFHDFETLEDWKDGTRLANGNLAPNPLSSGEVTSGESDDILEFNLYFDRKKYDINVYYFYNKPASTKSSSEAFAIERFSKVWGSNTTEIVDGKITGFNPMLHFNDPVDGSTYKDKNCIISYTADRILYDGNYSWPEKQFDTVASLTDGKYASNSRERVMVGQHVVNIYVRYNQVDTTKTFDCNVKIREYGKSSSSDTAIVSDETVKDDKGVAYPGYTFKVVNKSKIYDTTLISGITPDSDYPGLAQLVNKNNPYTYTTQKSEYTKLNLVDNSTAYEYFVKGDEKVIYIVTNNNEDLFEGNRYYVNINNSVPYILAAKYRDDYNAQGKTQIIFNNTSTSGYQKDANSDKLSDVSLVYTYQAADTYRIYHNVNGNRCSEVHEIAKGSGVTIDRINEFEKNCSFVKSQKQIKPGYSLSFYSDASCTQPISAISNMNSHVTYYGKFVKNPIDYNKYIYYELPENIDGKNYLTEADLPASDLVSEGNETKSVTLGGKVYTVDIKCYKGSSETLKDGPDNSMTITPLIYEYSIDGAKVLVVEKHKTYAFTTVSLNYNLYVIDGFEFDDKKPENALNGYVEDRVVNLRAYYDRITYTVRINQNNGNDNSSFTYRNGKKVTVVNPQNDGYSFDGFEFYQITTEDGKEKLTNIETITNTQGADSNTFVMPRFNMEIRAKWAKANVVVGIYEYFQTADGKYNEALTDSVLKETGEDCSAVVDGKTKSAKKYTIGSENVVAITDEGYTSFYIATVKDGSITAEKTDLFAAYRELNTEVETEITIADYKLTDSDFVYSSGVGKVKDNTISFADKDTVEAQYGMKLTYFYSRSGKYDVNVVSRTVENEKIAANIAINNGTKASLGTMATVTAKDTSGYAFKGWYKPADILENYAEGKDITTLDVKSDLTGIVAESTDSTYSFKMQSDLTLVALFAPLELDVSNITVNAKSDRYNYGFGYSADSVKNITAEVKFPADIDEAVYVAGYKWYACDTDGKITDATVLSTTSDYKFEAGLSCDTRYYKCVVELARRDNGKRSTLESNVVAITVIPSDIITVVKGVSISKTGTITDNGSDYVAVTYNGTDYSIKAALNVEEYPYLSALTSDDYSIYYALEPIDESNYSTAGTTDLIKIRNVTLGADNKEKEVRIYYYVLLKGEARTNYVTTSGSSTVKIYQKEIDVVADKSFYKVFDNTTAVTGSLTDTDSDKYRLSFGKGTERYYSITGMIEGERDSFTLDFDANYNNKHVSKAASAKLTEMKLVSVADTSVVNNNYKIIETSLDISAYITQKELKTVWGIGDDTTGVVSEGMISYPFNGNIHKPKVTITDLPAGLSVDSTGGQLNAGTHKAVAELTATDADIDIGDYIIDADNRFCDYKITKLALKVKPASIVVFYDKARHGIGSFVINDAASESVSGDIISIAGKSYKITMIAAEYKNGEVNEKVTDYVNAGTYPFMPYKIKVEAEGKDVTDNFDIEAVSENLIIKPVKVDVTGIKAKSKTYDEGLDAELIFDDYAITGVLDGDELILDTSLITGKFEQSEVANPRKVIINIPDEALLDKSTGTKAANYVLNKAEGSDDYLADTDTAQIKQKTVTLTPIDEKVTYGSNALFELKLPANASEDLKNAIVSGKIKLTVDGNDYIWTIPDGTKAGNLATSVSFADLKLNAGNHEVTYDLSAFTAQNYEFSISGKSNITVDKKSITISVKAIETGKELEKVYDTTTALTGDNLDKIKYNPSDYYQFEGVETGDAVVLNDTFTASYDSANVNDAKKIVLTNLSINNTNYKLDTTKIELAASITPADITLVVGNYTTTYGTPLTAFENKFTVKAEGLLGKDKQEDIIATVKYTTAYDGLKDGTKDVLYKDGKVDSYVITASNATYKNGNYTVVSYVPGKLTVNPKEVTVSVTPNTAASPMLNADGNFTMTYGQQINGNWFMPKYNGYIAEFEENSSVMGIVDSDVIYRIIRKDLTLDIENGSSYDAPRAGEFTINPVVDKLNSTNGNYVYKPNPTIQIVINKKVISFEGNPIKVDAKLYDGTTNVLVEQIKLGNNEAGLLDKDGNIIGDTSSYDYSYLFGQGIVSADLSEMILEKDINALKASNDSGIVFVTELTQYHQKDVGDNLDVDLKYELTTYLDERYELSPGTQKATKGSIKRRPLKITAVVTPDIIKYGDATPAFSNLYEGFVTVDSVTETYEVLQTSTEVPGADDNVIVATNGVEKWHTTFKKSDDKHAEMAIYTVTPFGFKAGNNNNYIVTYADGTVEVETAKLKTPEVKWSSEQAGEITFTEVPNIGDVKVNHYVLELYKEGNATPLTIADSYKNILPGTEHKYDFLEIIRSSGVGNYYVSVKAIADTEHNAGKINVIDSDWGKSADTHVIQVNLKMNGDSDTVAAVNTAALDAHKMEVYLGSDKKEITNVDETISRIYVEGEKNLEYGFDAFGYVATGYQYDSSIATGTDKSKITFNSTTETQDSRERYFKCSFNIGQFTTADPITISIKLKKAQSRVSVTRSLKNKQSNVTGALKDELEYGYINTPKLRVDVSVSDKEFVDYEYTYKWYICRIPNYTYTLISEVTDSDKDFCEIDFPSEKNVGTYNVKCLVTAKRVDNGLAVTIGDLASTSEEKYVVSVKRASMNVTARLTKYSWTYGESRADASIIGLPADSVKDTERYYYSTSSTLNREAWMASNAKIPPAGWTDKMYTDAGTYSMVAYLPDQSNYNRFVSTTVSYTINKAKFKDVDVASIKLTTATSGSLAYGDITWDKKPNTDIYENAQTEVGANCDSKAVPHYNVVVEYSETENGTFTKKYEFEDESDKKVNIASYIDKKGYYKVTIKSIPSVERDKKNVEPSDGVSQIFFVGGIDNESSVTTKIYDGEPIVLAPSFDKAGLTYKWYKGDSVVATSEKINITFVDENGEYYCEATDGTNTYITPKSTFTINPRPVTVTTATNSFTYDGTEHGDSTVVFSYTNDSSKNAFATGDTHTHTVTGKITHVAQTPVNNTYSSFVIKHGDKVVYTKGGTGNCYTVTDSIGKLSVTKRELNIKSASDTKVYDGTPLTAHKLESGVTYTGDVAKTDIGDVLTVTYTGTITNAGEADNTIVLSGTGAPVIKNGDTDVTNDYVITFTAGKLKVTQSDAEIKIFGSLDKTYDKKTVNALTTDSTAAAYYTKTGDGVVTFKYFVKENGTYKEIANPVNVGEYYIKGYVSKTNNYKAAESDYVAYKITPRPVTLTAKNKQSVYGNVIVPLEYTVTSTLGFVDDADKNSLAIKLTTTAGTVGEKSSKAVGVYPVSISYTANDNYDITLEHGVVDGKEGYGRYTITNATMSANSSPVNVVYDSKPHHIDVAVTANAVNGDAPVIYYANVPLNSGNYMTAGSTVNPEYTDVAYEGDTVSKYTIYYYVVCPNYDSVDGMQTVTISRRPLGITANSNSKVFDNAPLTDNGYKISSGTVAENDKVSAVSVVGSITKYSENSANNNVASNAVIVRKTDATNNVTKNYSITYTAGTLEITQRSLSETQTITVDDIDDLVYNGTYQKPLPVVRDGKSGQVLVKDADYKLTYSSNAHSGTAQVLITAVDGSDYKGSVTKNFTITKKPLVLTSETADKIYDGTPLTAKKFVTGVTYYGDTAKTEVIGDTVTANFTGTITNQGETDNTFTSVVITNSDVTIGTVTSDYEITNTYGKLKINEHDVEELILSEDVLTYTGNKTGPAKITVLADGVTLVEGRDYTVTVDEANGITRTATDVGIYVVEINGTGNYKGKLTKTYKVVNDVAPTVDGVVTDGNYCVEKSFKVSENNLYKIEIIKNTGGVESTVATYNEQDLDVNGLVRSKEITLNGVDDAAEYTVKAYSKKSADASGNVEEYNLTTVKFNLYKEHTYTNADYKPDLSKDPYGRILKEYCDHLCGQDTYAVKRWGYVEWEYSYEYIIPDTGEIQRGVQGRDQRATEGKVELYQNGALIATKMATCASDCGMAGTLDKAKDPFEFEYYDPADNTKSTGNVRLPMYDDDGNAYQYEIKYYAGSDKTGSFVVTDEYRVTPSEDYSSYGNKCLISYEPKTFILPWKVTLVDLPKDEDGDYVVPDKVYVKVMYGMSEDADDTESSTGYRIITQHSNPGDEGVACVPVEEKNGTYSYSGRYDVWKYQAGTWDTYYHRIQIVGYEINGVKYDVSDKELKSPNDKDHINHTVYYDNNIPGATGVIQYTLGELLPTIRLDYNTIGDPAAPATGPYNIIWAGPDGGEVTAEQIRDAQPTRNGYIFLGWADKPTGGNYVSFPVTLDDHMVLYAQWEKIPDPDDDDEDDNSYVPTKAVVSPSVTPEPTQPVRRKNNTTPAPTKEAASDNNVIASPATPSTDDKNGLEIIILDDEKGRTDVAWGLIPNRDQVIGSVISDEDKEEAIASKIPIYIRLTVEQGEITSKEPPTAEELEKIAKLIPGSEGKNVVFDSYIELKLEKKIGDKDWERIYECNEPIDVVVNLSEEAIAKGEKLYLILITEDGYELITDLDDMAETISFKSKDFQSDYMFVTLEEEDKEKECFIHYLVLIILILSTMSVIVFWEKDEEDEETEGRKKRSKGHFAILVVLNGIGAVIVYFGFCRWDIIFEIASIVITSVIECIKSYKNRR